jgi:ATP-binding protein involved in chromosome partitioning
VIVFIYIREISFFMPLPVIHDEEHKPKPAPKNPVVEEQERIRGKLKDIKIKIGVHSGKGGVGKTFVACNLAMTLAAEGYQVGLLDADIDCPNVNEFLNLKGDLLMHENGKLVPLRHKNIKVVSTGSIQPPGEPLIIRGPIKHRVLTDFMEVADWGPLDYLVIDFPPGTSDVPLSAMQMADLTGVILVTTPQKESVVDVTRAAGMARKMDIPIIGLIANMEGEVFGHVGEELAKKLQIPFIGSIPLAKEIRELSDKAEPAFLYPVLDTFTTELLKKIPK